MKKFLAGAVLSLFASSAFADCILYTHRDGRGDELRAYTNTRSGIWEQPSMPDGYNDYVSSLHVDVYDAIVVYEDSNYRGKSLFLGPGFHNLKELGFRNIISSFYCYRR